MDSQSLGRGYYYPGRVRVGAGEEVIEAKVIRAPMPRPAPYKWLLSFARPETFPDPTPHNAQAGFFCLPQAIAQQLSPSYLFVF